MKIPVRVRTSLPDGHIWIVTEIGGQLIVYLDDAIPPDSPLEQVFVRQAVRAWQRRNYNPWVIPPLVTGATWMIRKVWATRAAAAAAGSAVVAAGTAVGIVQLVPHHSHVTRPPAVAPSGVPSAPSPVSGSPVSGSPKVSTPAVSSISVSPAPTAGLDVGAVPSVGVGVSVRPSLPSTVPSGSGGGAGECRLVQVRVGLDGRQARVCV